MSGSLGQDLETEILMRLPAKSLMRFKSVQRSWNILFKTPTFTTKHKRMHMSNDQRFMILHEHRGETCLTFLSSCDDQTPTTRKSIKSLFSYSLIGINMYGNSNGVFCLQDIHYANRGNLTLWNPTTREVHVIPPPPSFYHHPLGHTIEYLIGFGADPNTNDFKVVKLNVDKSMWQNLSPFSVEIYNLSTESWTHVHRSVLPSITTILSLCPTKYNTLVNGVYHWITSFNPCGVSNILRFDFGDNRFSIITTPVVGFIGNFFRHDVAEINGSLAYVLETYEYFHPMRLEIWVMDQNDWVKKYSIGPLDHEVRVHAIWKGKDGVGVLGKKTGQPLTVYDSDGTSIRQFQIDVLDNPHFSIHEYVESITPLSKQLGD